MKQPYGAGLLVTANFCSMKQPYVAGLMVTANCCSMKQSYVAGLLVTANFFSMKQPYGAGLLVSANCCNMEQPYVAGLLVTANCRSASLYCCHSDLVSAVRDCPPVDDVTCQGNSQQITSVSYKETWNCNSYGLPGPFFFLGTIQVKVGRVTQSV